MKIKQIPVFRTGEIVSEEKLNHLAKVMALAINMSDDEIKENLSAIIQLNKEVGENRDDISTKLTKTGDTMSGPLTMESDVLMAGNDIKDVGEINHYTFESGQEDTDVIKFDMLNDLFNLVPDDLDINDREGFAGWQKAFGAALQQKFDLYVRITETVKELQDLIDVSIGATAERQGIYYNGSQWVNRLMEVEDVPELPKTKINSLVEELNEITQDIIALQGRTTTLENEYMESDVFLDEHGQIKLEFISDTLKQGVIVVANQIEFEEIDTRELLSGSKAYVIDPGDGYVFDGIEWKVTSKAEWENINLDWSNIPNAPKDINDQSLKNDKVYTKDQADAEFVDQEEFDAHTHTESDITDLDKYTQAEVDTALGFKAEQSYVVAHEADKENPHEVTKSQVGLSEVDNVQQATKEEFESHRDNVENPHQITKAQVGLGSVDDTSDADKPISTLTQQALDEKADQSYIEAHENKTDNPHQVTAEQVDTYTKSVLDGKFDAKVDTSKLGTDIPLLDEHGQILAQYIGEQYRDVREGFFNFNAEEEPIEFFKDEAKTIQVTPYVGALFVDRETSIPYRWSEDTQRFINLAPSVVGLGTFEGTAYPGHLGDENRTAIQDHVADTNNPHGVSREQLDVYSKLEVDGVIAGLNEVYVAQAEGMGLSKEDFTTELKDKLIAVEAGAQVNTVTSVQTRTGDVTITKTDVGLSNVENYSVASQEEAEAGISNERYVTPLRLAQAIPVLAPQPEIATTEEAEAGLIDDKLMTPLKTAEAIQVLSPPTDVSVEYAKGVLDARDESESRIWTGTAEQYEALTEIDPNTVYIIEGLGNVSIARTELFSTTLDTNWTENGDIYTKTQTIDGMLITDTPIVDVILSGNLEDDQERLGAWGQIYRIVTANDSITVYAFAAPEVSLPIQLRVVR